jgi:hypothetical protein
VRGESITENGRERGLDEDIAELPRTKIVVNNSIIYQLTALGQSQIIKHLKKN